MVCIGLYFELMPKAENIEFVEPAPKEQEESLLDQGGFDPEQEMLKDTSLVDSITEEEKRTLDDYMKKAEDIFRKQFTKEADKILSKVLNDSKMSDSEKEFMTSNNAMRDELMQLQTELAEQAGISDDRAGRISTEVLNQLYIEKQKKLIRETLGMKGSDLAYTFSSLSKAGREELLDCMSVNLGIQSDD